MQREIFGPEHEEFRRTVREFVAREITPRLAAWEENGVVDPAVWRAAGRQGLLAPDMDAAHGGGGVDDYLFHVVRGEELARAGTLSPAFNLHSEVAGGYLAQLADPDQKARWLPGFCSGESIATVAISEPEAGSDVSGIRTTLTEAPDGTLRLSGRKSFVTHGLLAGLVIVAALDPALRRAGGPPVATLVVLRPPMQGLTVGRPMAKIGIHSLDTVELSFDDVRVEPADVLGRRGLGFLYLLQNLPRERLSIAVSSLAFAERVFEETLVYCGQRKAFGQPIGHFQHNRFQLAEMATALQVARAFTDRCVAAHARKELEVEEASMAKWWNSELCNDVVGRCLQLHGGYGFSSDLLVGRAYTQARVQTIYGGTTEIMKEIIGQSLPL